MTGIPIVEFKDLSLIYQDAEAANQRYRSIIEAFQQKHHVRPDFVCRSPGRVNLIGEHIDYSGYGVLPMAIERDMVMAISVSKDGSCLSNLDSKFQSCEFKANVNIDIDSSVHIWSNYFLCGFKGICQSLGLKDVKDMYIMAHGTVPAGGGLSSSSAFVCCSAVGTHFINNGNLNKTEMTEAAILGEHFAGVQTGGMDQSISIMAPFGSALFIEFFPKLTASVVQFPKLQVNPIFVVANTLVVADKHTTAPTNYNLRVVETRLAAAVLHKFLTGETTTKIITLRNIQDLVGNSSDSNERKLELLSDIVDKHLEKLPYTLQDISSLLHLTEEQIKSLFIGSIVIKADKGFKLHARSKHTYLEALRVLQFKNICLNGSPNTIAELGTLMNASHESCRDLFECSCSELDELTGIALGSGAMGSRLTGAGWGGCTVSIVPDNQVGEFIAKIKERYYLKKFPALKENSQEMDNYIFASKPGLGAAIFSEVSNF